MSSLIALTFLMAVVSPAPQVGGCLTPSFDQLSGSPYSAGDGPIAVAVADFNRDGKPDVAVVGEGSDNVTIRWGNGGGWFPTSSTIAAGNSPRAVAVADFNLDGAPDLAVVNALSSNVTIRLNNGAGAFPDAGMSTVGAGTTPTYVVSGDFNLDGAPDLAIVNSGSNNVTIRLGDGTGAFPTVSSTVGAGIFPRGAAVGDFNYDGNPDIAIANSSSNDLTMRFGDGMGAFPTSNTTVAGMGPKEVKAADFNGDGRLDLAVSSQGSQEVWVYYGQTSGVFGYIVPYPAGATQPSLETGDFNVDGNADIAVCDVSSNTVTVWLGTGTFVPGNFEFPPANRASFSTGNFPFAVAAGDFNVDGKADLVVGNNISDNVTVLMNKCAATPCDGTSFVQPPGSPFTGIGDPTDVEFGDFNGDGYVDFAMANAGGSSVTVRYGNGTGTFNAANDFSSGPNASAIASADLDLDGDLDLAVNRDGAATLLFNDGLGLFFTNSTIGTPVPGLLVSGVAIGDFDRDGDPDLALANKNSGNVTIWRGDGTGAFPSEPSSTLNTGDRPEAVAIADFDRDGALDLVVSCDTFSFVRVYFGNGQGGFPTSMDVFVGVAPKSVVVGDFNGDGNPDFAVALLAEDVVRIHLGNGQGHFLSSVYAHTLPLPRSLAVGDLNADGKLDLAISHLFDPRVIVRLGDGTGAFPVLSATATLSHPNVGGFVAIADMNLDGKPDLAAIDPFAGAAMILLNTCPSNPPPVAVAGPTQTVQCAGATTQVTLNGSGSTDDEVSELEYSWTEGGTEIATGANPTLPLATGSHAITLTVTDAVGHTSSDDVTVHVVDTLSPVITMAGSASMTVECHTSFVDPGATASDLCAGPLPLATFSTVNVNSPGFYVIDYLVTHGEHTVIATRVVQVVDTLAPVITMAGSASMTVECHTSFVDPGATASDLCAGPLPIATFSTVNVNSPGFYVIDYLVTHGEHVVIATRVVQVVDTLAPVITMAGSAAMTVECHTSFVDPGATANDLCAGPVSVSVSGSVDVNTPGVYTITYTATASSQTTSTTRTVTVSDTTAPLIEPSASVISLGTPNHQYASFNVRRLATYASDVCDSTITSADVVIASVSSDEPENAGGDADGNTSKDIVIAKDCKNLRLRAECADGGDGRVYTVTLKVKDAAGNVGTVMRQVFVPVEAGGTAIDSGAGAGYTVSGCSP